MKSKCDGEPIPSTPYTPGPWEARDYKTAEGHIWVDCEAWARKKNGVLVRSSMGSARTVGGTLATVMATGTGEGWTVEANARLIAAAPELAEALAGLLGAESYLGASAVANCCHCSKLKADEHHDADCPVSAALAALAKAGLLSAEAARVRAAVET